MHLSRINSEAYNCVVVSWTSEAWVRGLNRVIGCSYFFICSVCRENPMYFALFLKVLILGHSLSTLPRPMQYCCAWLWWLPALPWLGSAKRAVTKKWIKKLVPAFQTGNSDAFEIPLGYVNQCNPGKNEVTLEFHPVRTCYLRSYLDANVRKN